MPGIFSDHSGLSRPQKYVALCTQTVHLWAAPLASTGHITGVALQTMIDTLDRPPKQTDQDIVLK